MPLVEPDSPLLGQISHVLNAGTICDLICLLSVHFGGALSLSLVIALVLVEIHPRPRPALVGNRAGELTRIGNAPSPRRFAPMEQGLVGSVDLMLVSMLGQIIHFVRALEHHRAITLPLFTQSNQTTPRRVASPDFPALCPGQHEFNPATIEDQANSWK